MMSKSRKAVISWCTDGTKDFSMAVKNRSEHDLQQQLRCISRERTFSLRQYEYNRLKLTKDLIEMDKYYCHRSRFDPLQYSFWTEDDLELEKVREDRKKKKINRPKTTPASLAKGNVPACLYGEDITEFKAPRRTAESDATSTVSYRSSSVLSEKAIIMEKIRRIKDEACARKATYKPRLVVTNSFVHEFEWLDFKHSRWFMEKTSKKYHNMFGEYLKNLPPEKEPLYLTQNQIFKKHKKKIKLPHTA